MKEVTFVISGIFDQQAKRCADSIRKFFPQSPIILSTWTGAVVPPNIFYKVIMSEDPGFYGDNPDGPHANLYRMIHSVSEGLDAVDTKFSVRIRPDFYFCDDGLRLFNFTESKSVSFKIFKKRIIALDYFFRNPTRYPLLYHPSDMFHYGLTSDLSMLWKKSSLMSDALKDKKYIFDLDRSFSYKYFSEQYIWVACLRSFGYAPKIKYQTDLNNDDYHLSEHSLAENFDIYPAKNLGLVLPNKFLKQDAFIYSMNDFTRIRDEIFAPNYFYRKLPHQLKKIRRGIKFFIKNR